MSVPQRTRPSGEIPVKRRESRKPAQNVSTGNPSTFAASPTTLVVRRLQFPTGVRGRNFPKGCRKPCRLFGLPWPRQFDAPNQPIEITKVNEKEEKRSPAVSREKEKATTGHVRC